MDAIRSETSPIFRSTRNRLKKKATSTLGRFRASCKQVSARDEGDLCAGGRPAAAGAASVWSRWRWRRGRRSRRAGRASRLRASRVCAPRVVSLSRRRVWRFRESSPSFPSTQGRKREGERFVRVARAVWFTGRRFIINRQLKLPRAIDNLARLVFFSSTTRRLKTMRTARMWERHTWGASPSRYDGAEMVNTLPFIFIFSRTFSRTLPSFYYYLFRDFARLTRVRRDAGCVTASLIRSIKSQKLYSYSITCTSTQSVVTFYRMNVKPDMFLSYAMPTHLNLIRYKSAIVALGYD